MNNLKVIFSFDRMSDAELGNKAQSTIAAMTGNAYFPNPNPPMPEVQTAVDDFMTALSAAQSGDRVKIAIKNEKRESLINILRSLSRYTEMVANGNRSILMSSGFEVSKERATTTELGLPENVHLVDGVGAGELIVNCSSVSGAKSYQFQYTADPITPDSVWAGSVSTKSETVLRGLKSGVKYWCRVVAIGSNDRQTISNPVARIVQ